MLRTALIILAFIAYAGRSMAATDAGEVAFSACTMCHAVDPKQTDLPGPNLFGVLCRPPAALSGFDYTPGMKAFAKTHPLWTPALVDQYLVNPQALVPDSPMELPPQVAHSATTRAQVIGYLKQHSGGAAKACPK